MISHNTRITVAFRSRAALSMEQLLQILRDATDFPNSPTVAEQRCRTHLALWCVSTSWPNGEKRPLSAFFLHRISAVSSARSRPPFKAAPPLRVLIGSERRAAKPRSAPSALRCPAHTPLTRVYRDVQQSERVVRIIKFGLRSVTVLWSSLWRHSQGYILHTDMQEVKKKCFVIYIQKKDNLSQLKKLSRLFVSFFLDLSLSIYK